MYFENLREYVESLEEVDQLRRIRAKVSVDLEIAEILRRVMYKNEGPAILFENVEGYKIPVLGNAFGSLKRLKMALNIENFEEIGERMTSLTKLRIPHGLLDKFKMLPKLSELSDYAPKNINSGPVMEVIETSNPTLDSLPIIKSFPKDSGRFITFGITVSKNPETEIRNLGVYRLQVISSKKAIMHWQVHKRGALHYQMNRENMQKTEVAIIIGADPATVFSAVSPVPEGLDKFLFAGITRKKGIDLVKCRTIDLEVPASAEIVLEGYVDPTDLNIEGPFGDHTGYYTPPEPYPTFTLTAIMMRKNPIYLTTVVGKPILEDAYIGKVIERAFLPMVKLFQPEVVDFSMPAAGWFQGIAIVSIRKRYPGQAKKVMMGLWGLGQLALTKILIVVDEDIKVHDFNDVIWAVTTRSDPKRDTLIIE
ncbi:MAG TPA: menaquinone biosynthesis decarboxylase, partial [Nitrososphaeraceae archaeon]|nr:menaquinone biosynthesis decarboxylase [Nitrososphaeraceae archaeon]